MSDDNPYMTVEQLRRITSCVAPDNTIKFKWDQPVKFIGGRYNGFNGTMRWCGTTVGSVSVGIDNKFTEVVEDLKFLEAQPLQA